MLLDKATIAELIPHAGSMVLLDSATNINANSLRCYTRSHLKIDNPLRTARGLSASNGVEYAAQAVALHIALNNSASSQTGYLASCRNVQLKRRFLDEINAELQVEIRLLDGSVEMGLLKYAFVIQAHTTEENAHAEILRGELSIMVIHKGEDK